MIVVNFVAGKGSDLIVILDVFNDRILLFEIIPHLCYQEKGMLTTKAAVHTFLEVILTKIVASVHPVVKTD